jgi:lipase chaperone LimK
LHAELVADVPGLANEPMRFERAFALREVLSDKSLSPAARGAAIARIEATMVPAGDVLAEAEAARASRVVLELDAAEERLRSQGRSDEEIHALRSSMVGEEAAARLASLDRSRAEWQGRVRAYQQERAAIMAQMPASAEREQALAQLLGSRFDAREQLRVNAAMALLPSSVNTY